MAPKKAYSVGTCERCGRIVEVDHCENQDVADELATLHCECEDADPETEPEALPDEEPEADTEKSPTNMYTQGECDFCGQTIAVDPTEDQGWADEAATRQCDCPEAKAARKQEDAQEDREGKRETTLRDAKADIEDLFGDAADDRGEESLPPEERNLLFQAAVLVYDQAWRSLSVKVTQGLSLKISVTDKGKLTIQRDDSSTRKREHK